MDMTGSMPHEGLLPGHQIRSLRNAMLVGAE